MRIVHVTHGNTARASILGFERHILNLAVAQESRGSSVTVVVNQPGVFSDACHQHGIPVAVVEDLKQDALLSLFRELGAEVVHCHMTLAATQAIPVGNQIHVPCVLTLHTNALAERDAGAIGLFKKAKDAGLRFSAISVSKVLFEAVEKQGILGGDHYYVPNGTRPGRGREAPAGHPVGMPSPGCPNFISVGSMTTKKGLDIAILAMAEMQRRRGRDCPRLDIYGDGVEKNFLKEMVAVLSLADIVRFRGFQPDILDRCPSTNILLMSSRSETGPLVVLEAMSRGMPIVATEVGEVKEWLPDQRYGRVVPPNSIIALADAMESLLTDITGGRFDPELLIDRHWSSYTSEVMAERVEAVYQRAMLSESRVPAAGGV